MISKKHSKSKPFTFSGKLTVLLAIGFAVGIALGMAVASALNYQFQLAIAIVAVVLTASIFTTNFWLKRYLNRPIKKIVRVTEIASTGNEVLLKELTNSDLNWLKMNSRQTQVSSGTVLIRQQVDIDTLYIILDGTLTVVPINNNGCANECGLEKINHFLSGELLGNFSFLNLNLYNLNQNFQPMAVKALNDSIILSLSVDKLQQKIREDLDFTVRFYRVAAILLLNRFERIVKQFTRQPHLKIPPLKDVSLLFSELSDSDVNWMSEHGIVKEIPAGTILVQAGYPVEYFYLLLNGTAAIYFTEDSSSHLVRVLAISETEKNNHLEREIAQLTRGETIGEMALIDNRLPSYTFKALENLQVLAIDKQKISLQLQQNPGMASRFYRLVTMLISTKLQGLTSKLEYGNSHYQVKQDLPNTFSFKDEINDDSMDNLSLGGAKFNWMLKRLQIFN